VQTVATNVKFHSSQDKTSQSIATNVFRNTNQKAEEAQDLVEEAQVAEEALAAEEALVAEEAEDWVIATNTTTPVRDFVRMAFGHAGIELEFKGEGVDEKAYVKSCTNPEYQLEIGKEVLAVDPKYFRPTEVDLLIGDATKAKEKLGWVPEYDLKDLVNDMMQSDLKLMKKDQYLKDGGYRIMNYFE